MKKIFILMCFWFLCFGMSIGSSTKIPKSSESFKAVITFFFPSEVGGKYDCDGDRLHEGIAAVDFNYIPKGSVLNISNKMKVLAKDCGGRDVIHRKAARLRGFNVLVIDVWVSSKRKAEALAVLFPRIVDVVLISPIKSKKLFASN